MNTPSAISKLRDKRYFFCAGRGMFHSGIYEDGFEELDPNEIKRYNRHVLNITAYISYNAHTP